MVYEAPLTSYGRIELWLWGQTNLEDPQDYSEDKCCPPTNSWVDPELESVSRGAGKLRPTKGPVEIKTHDSHPGEHRDTGKVSKEANDNTEESIIG